MAGNRVNWADGFDLTAGPRTLGVSEASPETREYWEALDQGRLLIKRCASCAIHHHPRRIVCSGCGTTALDWIEAKGSGRVYSYSRITRRIARRGRTHVHPLLRKSRDRPLRRSARGSGVPHA
jgi:hypothetical protein